MVRVRVAVVVAKRKESPRSAPSERRTKLGRKGSSLVTSCSPTERAYIMLASTACPHILQPLVSIIIVVEIDGDLASIHHLDTLVGANETRVGPHRPRRAKSSLPLVLLCCRSRALEGATDRLGHATTPRWFGSEARVGLGGEVVEARVGSGAEVDGSGLARGLGGGRGWASAGARSGTRSARDVWTSEQVVDGLYDGRRN